MSMNIRFALILMAGFICQAAIVPAIAVGGAKPDIVLIIVAGFGFLGGAAPGAAGGFVGGLLLDLLTLRGIGLQLIVMTLIGGFSGRIEQTILGNSFITPMIVIGVISLFSQSLYMILTFVFGEPIEFFPVVRDIVLPSALYTAIIGAVIFPSLSRMLGSERQDKVFR